MTIGMISYHPGRVQQLPRDGGLDSLAKRWSLLVAALFGGLMLMGALWPLVGPLSPLMVLLLAAALLELMRSVRLRREAAVVAYLEQAVRLNLPLPQMMFAAAEGETGALRRRLVRIGEDLLAGVPLETAVALNVPELSRRTLGLVAAASRSGRIGAALGRLREEEQTRAAGDPTNRIFFRVYPIGVACLVLSVAGMVSILVMPKLQQICHDFRVEVPLVTRAFSESFSDVWVWAAPLLVIIFARLLAGTLLGIFAPQRRGRLWGVREFLAWHTPMLGRIIRDRDLADVCHALADAVEAGHGIDSALAEAQTLRLNLLTQRRVAQWAILVAGGAGAGEAARLSGLPAIISGLLASARGQSGAAEALRFLARYFATRQQRAAALVRAAAIPATAIVFGCLTLAVAMSVFMPILRILERLMPNSGVL